jgi:hypothetical protein
MRLSFPYPRLVALMALCAIAAIIAWPQISKKISPSSKEEKVSSNSYIDSDIQRSTLEVNERKEKAEEWDRWNIRVIFLAGFVAVCLGITAIGVSRSNGALVRSSEELSKAKDSKLALDLKAKDSEIAHAQELAGKANQRAEELAKENLEIKSTIDKSTAETLLREAELKAKNLETETQLEVERKERFELEKYLAPRMLPIFFKDSVADSDVLKKFKGIHVVVEFLPDTEASRAASEILNVMRRVGWTDVTVSPNPTLADAFFDGVVFERPLSFDPVGINCGAAADTFMELLRRHDWKGIRESPRVVSADSPTAPGHIAPNTIKINVGFKPAPDHIPEDMKEVMKRFQHPSKP